LSGILEYQPKEFTFTALAGTPLAVIEEVLSREGQYLPFDPPLVQRGATLGGAIASGLNGSRRYHYGGLRDFILGVRFLDGSGNLIRSGGKVVKNAAGFDYSKLLVGSLGRLGVVVEATFKVFPMPEAARTLRLEYTSLQDALEALYVLSTSNLDLDALDLEPSAAGTLLWARLAGLRSSLEARTDRTLNLLRSGPSFQNNMLEGDEEATYWERLREFPWASQGDCLVKVPVTPGRIIALDAAQAAFSLHRRYLAGGQAAWFATSNPEELRTVLNGAGLHGLVVTGQVGNSPYLGEPPGRSFYDRVKSALDPDHRFPEA
jgi:glycolate oxidase FAD binding subunit